jgi:hypothetical protein
MRMRLKKTRKTATRRWKKQSRIKFWSRLHKVTLALAGELAFFLFFPSMRDVLVLAPYCEPEH